MIIENDVIKSYIDCKYKAYLIMSGANVTPSNYENYLKDQIESYKNEAILSICKNGKKRISENIQAVSKIDLELGYDFLFNATVFHDQFKITYDGLKKEVSTKGILIDHYVPIYFVMDNAIREKHKLFAAILEFLLGMMQGSHTDEAVIVYGKEQKRRTINTTTYRNRAMQILNNIERIMDPDVTPSLIICDHCRACRFQNKCMNEAINKDELSLISGINEKDIKKLNSKGIFTINQLSYTFRPRRKRKKEQYKKRPFSPALKALSIREQKIHVLDQPNLPNAKPEIYFDIEGLPNESFYYLIGVVIIEDEKRQEYSFWAQNKEEEIGIFERFLELLKGYDSYTLFHYGAYETKALKNIKKKLNAESAMIVDKAIKSCTNLLSFLHANVYLPIYSNGLKEVGAYIGFKWSVPDASGLMSIVWRKNWENSADNAYKEKLIIYNKDDCYALLELKKLLVTIVKDISGKKTDISNIIHVDTMPIPSIFKFMTKEFAFPEIETIKDFAYFDYQRERVHVRSDKKLKKHFLTKTKTKNKRKYKPNEVVYITSRVCVKCKCRELDRIKQESKFVFDLKFFNYGVKRWVVKYVSYRYKCRTCGFIFKNPKFRRMRMRYGHRLMSWVIFQNIVNKESVRQIGLNLKELFQLDVPKSTIHYFKTYFSRYYNGTLKTIERNILESKVIYVDETPLAMKDEIGYAWVFTNMSSVISIYKPSREGDFLKEYLKDFKGILVSDFYPAYDSIDCIHQKCLIHLIRDFNDDLLSHPFDNSFKEIARRFTDILKAIVETIDKFGLKKRNLNKHKKQAENFFKFLESMRTTSEISMKYQARLLKNRGKLFQFLDYNDVAWNNGNAEHAIKLLATHTNRNLKFSHANHMVEHLDIMSIYQTCKYRNISFLNFLLSGERDIDRFP